MDEYQEQLLGGISEGINDIGELLKATNTELKRIADAFEFFAGQQEDGKLK